MSAVSNRISKSVHGTPRPRIAPPPRRRHRGAWRRLRSACLLALAVLGLLPSGASSAAPNEYDVKATLMVNFMKFVEWPDDTSAVAPGPLVLAVVGNDPFGAALERATAGQSVNGRSVVVKRWKNPRELGPCHVLFVAVSDADEVSHILGGLKGTAVLTIGDGPSFVSEGGIIGFFMHDSRIRFDISPTTAERAHLRISSRLLAVAHVVQGER
jgi:hypothetical protein